VLLSLTKNKNIRSDIKIDVHFVEELDRILDVLVCVEFVLGKELLKEKFPELEKFPGNTKKYVKITEKRSLYRRKIA
jgi:hypothetical protein